MPRWRPVGPRMRDPPRTWKSSLTLAAFLPWGSSARYHHAGGLALTVVQWARTGRGGRRSTRVGLRLLLGCVAVGAADYPRGVTIALYRRYRPQTFADVIGQEHVTEPLMQALRTGRVGHAYLFSGPRGCGKTTSARILARCLNCEQGPTPTPCGECGSCVALATGGPGSVDVIEIDAASHGGVDDARDLREKAAYGPAQSRYKVYIIDEAHMVTPQGFNALLKIVEEPPEHVKFVFATTEPEKVIGTIRSRTHHYPFRLVPPSRLTEYLETLCEREEVAVEPGVVSFVVRAGGGSVRDSLSVLDQLIAGSGQAGLTYAGAAALLGFTEAELLDAVVDALAAGDGGAVFRQLDKVIETGHDPRRFVEDLLERFRDLIIVAASEDAAAAVLRGVPEDQLHRMRQQAASFGPGELSRSADIVNAGLTELSGTTAPRLQLELICARLLLPAASGTGGYAARLDRIERRLDMAGPVPPVGTSGGGHDPAPVEPLGAQHASGGPQSREGWEARGGPPAGSESAAPSSGGREALRRAHAAARGGPGQPGPEPAGPDRGVAAPAGPDRAGRVEPPESTPADDRSAPATPRGGLDTDAVRRSWPDVLAKVYAIRRVTWTFLSQHAQVLDYDGRGLVLGIATEGLVRTFHHGSHAEVVRQALIETLGIDAQVDGRLMPARGTDPPSPPLPSPSPMGPRGAAARGPAPQQPAPQQPAPQPPAPQPPAPQPQFTRPPLDRRAEEEPGHPPEDDWAPVGGPKGDVLAGMEDLVPPDDGPEPPPDDASDVGPDVGPEPEPAEALEPPLEPPLDEALDQGADLPRDDGASADADVPLGADVPAVGEDEAPADGDVPAGGDLPPRDPPTPQQPEPQRPAQQPTPSRRGAAKARVSAYERAKAALGEQRPSGSRATGAGSQEVEDPQVSVDDEDISDLGAVGQPVIAKVLGGVVIDEQLD